MGNLFSIWNCRVKFAFQLNFYYFRRLVKMIHRFECEYITKPVKDRQKTSKWHHKKLRLTGLNEESTNKPERHV